MNPTEIKKQLYNQYFILAQWSYEQFRNHPSANPKVSEICTNIAKLEKELYDMGGQAVPPKEAHICPGCKAPYTDDTAFCGECGMNLTEFYKAYTRECSHCHTMAEEGKNYCGVCGNRL